MVKTKLILPYIGFLNYTPQKSVMKKIFVFIENYTLADSAFFSGW